MSRLALLLLPALIACSSPSLRDETGDVYLLMGQSNMVYTSYAIEGLLIRQSPHVQVLKAAVGGTNIAQWQKGGPLYAKAIDAAKQTGRPVTAIFWHQGEQDAFEHTAPADYERLLTQLFTDLRSDLGPVPIVAGEIGRWLKFPSTINASIHAVAHTFPNVAVVSSEDLTNEGDAIHFSPLARRALAERYVAHLPRDGQEIRRIAHR